MANDELREIFDESMKSVISDWLEEGLSEKKNIRKADGRKDKRLSACNYG